MAGKVLFVTGDADTGPLWAGVLDRHSLETALAGDRHDRLALCRRLRAGTFNPILLLTADCDETFCLEVYRAGADECIPKPFGPAVLAAKVVAWLRQAWTMRIGALGPLEVGGLCLEPPRRRLIPAQGPAIPLSTLEFGLMYLLMSRPGQVLAPEAIVRWVWGRDGGGDSGALRSAVHRLRLKIEPDPERPRYIQTVAGRGYAFCGS